MGKNVISLFEEMEIIENYNSFLDRCLDQFNYRVESFISGTIPFEPLKVDLRYINVEDNQLSAINKRREENQLLDDAIIGKKGIKDSLHEIANLRRGKKWIPCLKDDDLNHKIDLMIDLLGNGDLMNFKINGFFAFNNPITTGVYMHLITLVPLLALEYFLGPNQLIDVGKSFFPPYSFLIGMLTATSPKSFPYQSRLPWKKAEYLDNKIDELF